MHSLNFELILTVQTVYQFAKRCRYFVFWQDFSPSLVDLQDISVQNPLPPSLPPPPLSTPPPPPIGHECPPGIPGCVDRKQTVVCVRQQLVLKTHFWKKFLLRKLFSLFTVCLFSRRHKYGSISGKKKMGYSVTLSILFYLLTCTWALRCDNMTDSCNSTHIEVKSQCDRVIAMSELCSQLGCNPNATCNMQCTGSSAAPTNAKRCSQSCSGRECPVNMTCDVSNNCIQNCKEFCDLSLMKCSNSASCTQVCNKGCKKMQCTSAKCTQECDGGDCVMECTAKVTECVQKCQKAPCTMICDAKKVWAELQRRTKVYCCKEMENL